MRYSLCIAKGLKAFTRFILGKSPKLKQLLRNIINLFENRFRTDDIDTIIDSFSRMKKDVYFIQVGANDSIFADPIRTFIIRDGWSGILVEPLKHIFDRLVENYKGQESLIFENVAISDKDEIRKLWYLEKTDDSMPEWYEGLGSFLPEVVLKSSKKIPNIEKYMTKEQVKCVTLEALIKKNNVRKIDVFVVDTEGYDFHIIKQIDFEKFKPSIILYENKHLKDEEKRLCKKHLRKNGYKLIRKGGNTIAFTGKFN